MDMSHTSGNYAWNDANLRHNMKYESCSPTNTNPETTQSPPAHLPITLGPTTVTIPHHTLVGIPHAQRHPYHHLTTATISTYTTGSGGDSNSCSGVSVSGACSNNNSGRVDSPLLVGGSQQLNFATNNNEDMDCGDGTVTAYLAAGGLVAYRGGIGGLSGRGIGGVGASTGGNIGIGSSNRVSRQDPLSHRIIEKRRRDRMNNCLADLSRLIPAEYLKKGRGRVEKTEIIEMAIMHMKYLQHMNHYSLGYQDCMSETLRFLVEVEGQFPHSPLCVRLLAHLQQHRDAVCVRRGSGGSTSSTSHSPVGGGSNSMGGEGAMAAMVLVGEGVSAPNGMSITPTPTPTPTPSCHLPPLSSPTSPIPSNHLHHSCTKTQSSSTPHPCILKPPKLEPNNNEEDYRSNNMSTIQQHRALSPTCSGLEEDGDGCSTLDEGDDGKGHDQNGNGLLRLGHHDHQRHDDADNESKCSLQQRVQQIQLERHERHSEGYKYKNDIKLRFTQDVIGSSRRDSSGSTGNHSSVSPPLLHHHSDMCTQSPKLHSHTATLSNLRLPLNDMIDVKDTTFAVPIFALHNKGTFYVPLTVDYRALLPYLNGADLTTWPKDVILHPVAINVNFHTRKGHG